MIFDTRCLGCDNPIPDSKRADSIYCSVNCRAKWKHKTQQKERNKYVLAWKHAHKKRWRELEHKSYLKNKDKRLARGKERYYETIDYQKTRKHEFNKALKQEVFNHYGGKCYCCGETILSGLTLDHINQDGAAHRREIQKDSTGKGTAGRMWKWAKKHNYPDIFRVACWTCNSMAFYNQGVCPHSEVNDGNRK